uniref:Cytokine receptor like factor 3 n=1 Tax=Canis lupus familiaris TaxID=9615 RepID=A0A8C0P9B4_CANLF
MELEPELLLQEARESVEAAQSYRRELGQRLQGLREARRQIKESASQTRDVLKQHFNDLKGTLGKLLDERLVTLLQEVDTIEQETIKPLDDCQKLIEHGVNTAEDLVQEEWTAGFEGYSLSSRRNIALRNDSESSGVLYSSAPTYFCGQTLTFRQVDIIVSV